MSQANATTPAGRVADAGEVRDAAIVPVFTRQRPAAGVPRMRRRTVPVRPATASDRRQVRRDLLVLHALEQPHDLRAASCGWRG